MLALCFLGLSFLLHDFVICGFMHAAHSYSDARPGDEGDDRRSHPLWC